MPGALDIAFNGAIRPGHHASCVVDYSPDLVWQDGYSIVAATAHSAGTRGYTGVNNVSPSGGYLTEPTGLAG